MQLPLLFQLAHPIFGEGFVAGVSMRGRALLEVEDGETWIAGVEPSGFAGGGTDRSAAFVEFRKAWMEILFDIAAMSSGFEEFHAQAAEFLAGKTDSLTADWEAALERVRSEGITDDTLPSVSPSEVEFGFEIVELDPSKFGPTLNKVEDKVQRAA